MQFMAALFGGSENTLLHSAFALGIVLVLIVLGLWLLKLVTRGAAGLGRNARRVEVVEKAMVDGKRQVLIIRRDNVEHLILTGGPQDLVIEAGIAPPEAATSPRRQATAAPRPAAKAAADIHTPPAADHPVPREAVDRLRDLARPAPLSPRATLRHTALLRPVEPSDKVIPMGTAHRGENSTGPGDDSATPSPNGNGPTPLGGRSRLLRGLRRSGDS